MKGICGCSGCCLRHPNSPGPGESAMVNCIKLPAKEALDLVGSTRGRDIAVVGRQGGRRANLRVDGHRSEMSAEYR